MSTYKRSKDLIIFTFFMRMFFIYIYNMYFQNTKKNYFALS